MHPTYEKCTACGFPATTDTTGCNFVFNSTTNATGLPPTSIECTSGYAIKVTIPLIGCTLTIAAQNTTGGTQVTNLGTGAMRDVTVHFTFKLKFTRWAMCPESIATEGEYTGTATLKGFGDNGVTGRIDETEGAAPGKDVEAKYSEGAQVGIWWE